MEKSDLCCSICKHTFSTKSALTKHKKTAKKCSNVIAKKSETIEEAVEEIGEDEVEITVAKLLKCRYEGCDYSTRIKGNHKRHENNCKHKPDESDVNRLQERIKELEDLYSNLKIRYRELKAQHIELKLTSERDKGRLDVLLRDNGKKPSRRRVEGDSIERIPFTEETVTKRIDEFDFKLYEKGIAGMAEFIKKISDGGRSYYCSDLNRLNFTRITGPDKKDIIKGEDCAIFMNKIIDILSCTSLERINTYSKKIRDTKHAATPDKSAAHNHNDAISLIQSLDCILFGIHTEKGSLKALIDKYAKEVAHILAEK